MEVVETLPDLKRERRHLKEPVGFVPTMGALHEGHLTLVRRAKKENASVVVSIFVNPAQFGPKEDLARYPRDVPRDLGMLGKEGADLIFVPNARVIYPEGFNTWVEVEKVTERLEGERRPGHLRGVATVVNKLFNMVEPARAYFGEKDAQQLAVIKRMVADLNMNVEVVPCPIIREWDGLARSSRNVFLSPEERKAATVLYRSLKLAEDMWEKGERNAARIRSEVTALIKKEPLAEISYVSIADPDTLVELDTIKGKALASLAVKVGKTRLIDNVTLG
ncbi:MAG TPA: pantoate--beta-alanine ligase [Dehalococcoidia bacterium]|nr:pantoate--beta-alanine ligase [Dehalococcoidia bacterium]